MVEIPPTLLGQRFFSTLLLLGAVLRVRGELGVG